MTCGEGTVSQKIISLAASQFSADRASRRIMTAPIEEFVDGKTIGCETPRESSIISRSKEGSLPKLVEGKEIELVFFDDDDPVDPKNLPKSRKVGIIIILCLLSFAS